MNVEEVKNAIAVLEQPSSYPGLIKRRNANLVFRIWSYPALSAFVSFSILEDQDEYFLRRIMTGRDTHLADGGIISFRTGRRSSSVVQIKRKVRPPGITG